MQGNTKETTKKVKAFVRDVSWKRVLTFMFFLLLSVVFWMIQIYRQKFEAHQVIPIRYTNVPDSILFVNEMPAQINAHIKDDGIVLFRYFFSKDNDTLDIDIGSLMHDNQGRIIQGAVMEQFIKSKLYPTSELLSYYPSYISFQYTPLNEKTVQVIYDGHIDLEHGRIIDGDIRIEPESIRVYGSKEALDTLNYVYTMPDTLFNITEDKIVAVDIKAVYGMKFVPDKVELTIPVDEFTQKDIEVPITCINLPKEYTVRFFPPTVKIPIYVGLKRYNDITPEDFSVTVDYNDLKDRTDPTISLRITSSPDFVRTKPPVPSEVEFIIEENAD